MSTAHVRYTRNPDYVFRKIVDELVLVPVRHTFADVDCIYTMNPVGAFIWEQLDGGRAAGEVVTAIVDRYDVDPTIAADDLASFLTELEAVGAVLRM